jgi:hypothetical protein
MLSFFIVPSNHDIDRSINPDVWRKYRDNLYRVDAQDVSRWLAGQRAPWGFEDSERDALLERQQAYRDWIASELKRPQLLPNTDVHPHLGYRQTLDLPDMPFPLHIIGLDSAWLAGDDHDAGQLRLTEDQVMRLSTDDDGRKLTGFRLALIHHPLDIWPMPAIFGACWVNRWIFHIPSDLVVDSSNLAKTDSVG